jgi:hypothetical protein
MASLGSKKDIQKRDLNFFAEFTAAAAKMTRLLGYGVVVGIVVVALIVGVIVWGVIRNMITQDSIDKLNNELNSPPYSEIEQKAQSLQAQLSTFNNYYYTLSQMRGQVDMVHDVPAALTDIIYEAIPSDTYVDNYLLTQTSLHIEGYTFSYYSALNFVKKLNDTDRFSMPVTLTIQRVDPSSIGTPDTFIYPDGKTVNPVNNYYNFVVEGALTSDVYVSVSRFLRQNDTVTSLGSVETKQYKQGEEFSYEGIGKYTQSGVNYKLQSIIVNRAALANNVVESIANDPNGGVLRDRAISSEGKIEIQLYYVVVENQEGGNT